jgi:hypothetical protein
MVCVGLPPSPRYGHSFLVLPNSHTVCVLGGIAVSPFSELSGSGLSESDTLSLMTASATLSKALRDESTSSTLGTDAFVTALTDKNMGDGLKTILHRAERIRGEKLYCIFA